MYNLLVILHSYTRWLVLIFMLSAVVIALAGLFGRRAWTPNVQRAVALATGIITLQFLIGLVLYFYPTGLAMAALRNIGAAMENRELRFFAVEHIFGMFIAVGLAHAGSSRSRKATTDLGKYRHAAIWFTLSLVTVLVSIPWWRPLLRPLL